LCIFASVLLASLALTGAGLALAARAAGSPRGRWAVGLLAAAVITGVGVVVSMLAALAPGRQLVAGAITNVALSIAELLVIWLIVRRVFRLSIGRTFAVFGVYLLLVGMQFGLMLAVVKPYLIEAFVVSTRSMSPTIAPGDRFIVNKQLRPRRWDLVAYKADQHGTVYCHRLVGLPGERLRFDQGNVVLNDKRVTAPAVVAGHYHASPSGWYPSRYHDGETIVLGPREIFLVGDNVDVSGDSRVHGPSSLADVVGVVDVVYWPLRKARIVR
jgi:signal peptidase I